jgi:hypothetical protein
MPRTRDEMLGSAICRNSNPGSGDEGVTAHKKTEITIETEKILTIRRRRSLRAFCPDCGCEVDMVSLAEVGALTGMPQRTLADAKSLQGWHVSEDADGLPVICLQSLLKAI